MTPQLLFLRKNGLLQPLSTLITNFLSSHNNKHYTSHEILNYISNNRHISQLYNLLISYNGGFSEVSSHIGAVSSHLARQNILIHSTKKCSVLNKTEDSFKF